MRSKQKKLVLILGRNKGKGHGFARDCAQQSATIPAINATHAVIIVNFHKQEFIKWLPNITNGFKPTFNKWCLIDSNSTTAAV
jgi:hypothetical protein